MILLEEVKKTVTLAANVSHQCDSQFIYSHDLQHHDKHFMWDVLVTFSVMHGALKKTAEHIILSVCMQNNSPWISSCMLPAFSVTNLGIPFPLCDMHSGPLCECSLINKVIYFSFNCITKN